MIDILDQISFIEESLMGIAYGDYHTNRKLRILIVQSFEQILVGETSLNDIRSICFGCFVGFSFRSLLSCLWGFFESKIFQNIQLVRAEVFCHILQVHDVGFYTVSFALNFELHLRHSVPIVGVNHCGRNVQHCLFKYQIIIKET